jgi:hypothetical protein
MKNRKTTLGLILVSLTLLGGFPAVAQIKCWTSPGSTPTVDEADLATTLLGSPLARVSGAAPLPATVDLRYNVIAVDGLFGGDQQRMTLRYRDNGAGAQVLAFLRQQNILTGLITTPLVFDSDSFPPDSGFQVRSVGTACFGGFAFDFVNNVYFVEVQLKKTAVGGNPVMGALQICLGIC